MKKNNLLCYLLEHDWNETPEVDKIVSCMRCRCVKKVIRIDIGAMGGQEAIFESDEGGDKRRSTQV